MARILSLPTAIFLFTSPRRELGRSMTRRGGESSVCTSGITGPPLEIISIAGTPRSCTMRTLVTVGGGPNVWAATVAPGKTDASRMQTDWRAFRKKVPRGGLEGNISLGMDAREEIGGDIAVGVRRSASGVGRSASDFRPQT